MFESESEPGYMPERRDTPVPTLKIEIPNGHMGTDIHPSQLYSPPFGSYPNHRSRCGASFTSPTSPRTTIKQNRQRPPQRPNPGLNQFGPVMHDTRFLRNPVYTSGSPMRVTQSSIGVKISHSQILGHQYTPETSIRYPQVNFVPPQNVQPPSVGSRSPLTNIDTTATRHWPPHRVVFRSSSQSTLPSIKSAVVVSSRSNVGGPSITDRISSTYPTEIVRPSLTSK
ncbi:hypothetical protein NX059_007590 [Plenodomus lindquistii]|nr:hypothetical protein NX059_007590 [Plenodomus lindquistii]